MSTHPPETPPTPPTVPTGTPVQAAAPTPPVATPTTPTPPAITNAGGYFKSSKQKTIAMIVAGVLLIGALGGISALVFGGDDKTPMTSGTSGVGDGDIFDPTPVGTPVPQPTNEPGPTPAAPAPAGKTVTIGDGVEIPVPSGWKVFDSTKAEVWISNGQGSVVQAIAGSTKSTDALALVPEAQDLVFSDNIYTSVTAFEPRSLDAVGSIVSMVIFNYDTTLTDLQSSFPVTGAVVIAIRQDGTILILNFAHEPPNEWNDSLKSISPLVDGALDLFAGL